MQRLGSFRFDPATLTLTRAGAAVRAAPKTLELLAILVRVPGAIVTHAELRARLWPQAFVEERNLGQQVYLLRGIFAGDSGVRIENVPRRGYRLVIAERQPEAEAEAEAEAEVRVTAPLPAARRRASVTSFARAAIVAGCAFLFASAAGPALHARPAALAPEAAKAYERGRLLWERRDLASLATAERYFKRTLALAPGDPHGYAGLAAVEAIRGNLASVPSVERASFERARRLAERALARDPDFADALAVRALLLDLESSDYTGAETLLRRAQRLDPHNAYAHVWLGVVYFRLGRLSEARRELACGEELAPGSKTAARWLGYIEFSAHALDAAARQFRSVLDIDPSDEESRIDLAQIDEARRDYGRAIARLSHGRSLASRDKRLTIIARLEALRGRRDRARREFARVAHATEVDALELAATQLALGRPADALASLRRGERKDNEVQRWLQWDPRFAALRRLAGLRESLPSVN